jgi:hypothetical protein
MDAIVQAAGTALVQAIATDAWGQVKEALTALWRRVHPGHADELGRDLDELRTQVLQAHADDSCRRTRRGRRNCGSSWTRCSSRLPRRPGPPGPS